MYATYVVGFMMKPKVLPIWELPPGTKWEDVPEDFTCPLCSVGKDMFSKQ